MDGLDGIEHIPYLSGKKLEGLGITTRDVINEIEKLIKKSADNSAWNAAKAVIQPGDDRYMMAALAAMDDPDLLAVKTVVLNPENTANNLPQINGLVTVLDSRTGLPIAILDGNWVTGMRTACLSATAAKYLAREDAKTAGFIGCGVQARSHLKAFSDIYQLDKVLLFGRGEENLRLTGNLAEELGLEVEIIKDPQVVLQQSDILTTSVTYVPGLEPFLNVADMKSGSFATIADLAAPWDKASFSDLDALVIDDLNQEKALPNKMAALADIDADLFDLVTTKKAQRQSAEQRTAFVFRGLAFGDLAMTSVIVKQMRQVDAI